MTKKALLQGMVAVLVSAFLFGATPILAKISYAGGNNAIMLAFLRSALALSILYGFAISKKISLKLNKEECIGICFSGSLGAAVTTILLYSSYDYLDVGMATALHFMYPLLIMVYSMIAYQEKTGTRAYLHLF